MRKYLILSIASNAVLITATILIYIRRNKLKKEYFKKGIGKAYTDMNKFANKIQYRKVNNLFTQMLNDLNKEGKI